MFEGLQITFSVQEDSYGIGIENDDYKGYIGIKHNKKKENKRLNLKPYISDRYRAKKKSCK